MMAGGAAGGPPPESVAAAEVVQKDWQPVLRAVGSISPVQGAMLSAELPGIVAEIGFENGADVKKGDLMVRLVSWPGRGATACGGGGGGIGESGSRARPRPEGPERHFPGRTRCRGSKIQTEAGRGGQHEGPDGEADDSRALRWQGRHSSGQRGPDRQRRSAHRGLAGDRPCLRRFHFAAAAVERVARRPGCGRSHRCLSRAGVRGETDRDQFDDRSGNAQRDLAGHAGESGTASEARHVCEGGSLAAARKIRRW